MKKNIKSVTRQKMDDDDCTSVEAKLGQCATIATNYTNHKMLTGSKVDQHVTQESSLIEALHDNDPEMAQKKLTEVPKFKNEVAKNTENKWNANIAFCETIEETTVIADNSSNYLNCFCLHVLGYGIFLLMQLQMSRKNTFFCVFVLLLAHTCLEVKGNVLRDEARKCYRSDTEGTSIGDIDGEKVCHIPELMSHWCEAPQDATCPSSDHDFNLWANDHCMYSCKNSEKIVCFDTDDGMHFICLPKDIECPEGLRWNVSFKRSTGMVEIHLEECPLGWYQDKPSKCIDACKSQHFPKYYIPKGFQLLKDGDNIHPQLFMCNFSSGYYNPQNKSFIKGDSQFMMIRNEFCVNSPNPCSKGKMVLHNGTCVDECMFGHRREAPDFYCRQMNDENKSGIVSTVKEKNFSSVTSHQQPVPQLPSLTTSPYDTSMISDLKTASSLNLPEEGKKDEGATQMHLPSGIIVLLVFIAIAVVSILIVLAVYFLRKCNQNESGHNEISDASDDSGNQENANRDAALQAPLLSDHNIQNGSTVKNINTDIKVGNRSVNIKKANTVNICNGNGHCQAEGCVLQTGSNSDETTPKSV